MVEIKNTFVMDASPYLKYCFDENMLVGVRHCDKSWRRKDGHLKTRYDDKFRQK